MPGPDPYSYNEGDPHWKEPLKGYSEGQMPALFKREEWGKYSRKDKNISPWTVSSRLWPEKLYMKTPAAVQAVNKKFPIKKRVWDDTGFDKFKNSLSKGWADFTSWAKKHLGPLKGLINMVMNFVPGGKAIQGAIEQAMGKVDNALGGKTSRDFSLYDFLFIYRNCICALLLKLAIDYKVPVDVVNFKKLFHTTPEFKNLLAGKDGGTFAEMIIDAEDAAQKIITNNNAAEVPSTRQGAFNQTMDLVKKLEHEKGPEGQKMVVGQHTLKEWLK